MSNFLSRIRSFLSAVRSFFTGVFGYGVRHKIQAGIIVLALAGAGYWGYSSWAAANAPAQYVLAAARMAPIEVSITGSGQVAANHQLDLSPKTSGQLTYVGVKAGDTVAAGEVIAEVDLTDAQKAIRDAEANLESAQISYQQSMASSNQGTEKARTDALAAITTALNDFSTIVSGINTIQSGKEVSGTYAVRNVDAYRNLLGQNTQSIALHDEAVSSYADAKSAYDTIALSYKETSQDANPASVLALAQKTYAAALIVAQAAKANHDFLLYVNNQNVTLPAVLASQVTTSTSYLTTAGNDVSSVLSAKNTLSDAIQSGTGGGESLDQQSAQLALTKAENALQDAKDNEENYIVRAPFAGTIAAVNAQVYDQASSGTKVATLITTGNYAELSLNETDAANVKIGQKATLTFDAIDGLSIPGTVAEVDRVGTVTQGVVSYDVKISFDTQDARVAPGMTVNATIVTAHKDSALVVPSSAVKSQGSLYYVEVVTGGASSSPAFGRFASSTASSTHAYGGFASSSGARTFSDSAGTARIGTAGQQTVSAPSVTLRRVPVTVGLASDTMTEITSGLNPGDRVVVQTIAASGKTTTTSSAPSLFGNTGARRTTTGGATVRTGAGAAGALPLR